jgi:hypothetical protein
LEELNFHHRFPVHHLAATPTPSATNATAPGASITPPETILITSMSYQGDVAVIQFTGNPQKAYILQAKDSLDTRMISSVKPC